MSEISGQCELCLNQANQISIRVFPCLYHCKKMLCIQHLSEHDKYIEKQIQAQKQLKNLWRNYNLIFDEDKLQEQLQRLKTKLENYQQLKQEIKDLLLINHFQDSMEMNQTFQQTIQKVQNAIEQSESISYHVKPKIELDTNDEETGQSNIDYSSSSSSVATNDESETMESLSSLSNTNGNSLPEDEYFQHVDEADDHGNSVEMDNEEEISFKDETNITPSRNITASRLRGQCPLTREGVFGISSNLHGIRLCPNRPIENQYTCLLNDHFRRVHHLTPLASLALARAIASGQDPMNTRLFSDHHIILNLDELRTVNCPIHKPFLHYPSLQIRNFPCDSIKQVHQLRDHLKRVHKFTSRAANLIIKSVKNDAAVHQIEFPRWINILENENRI